MKMHLRQPKCNVSGGWSSGSEVSRLWAAVLAVLMLAITALPAAAAVVCDNPATVGGEPAPCLRLLQSSLPLLRLAGMLAAGSVTGTLPL
jgi:hypothetical protein